MFRRREKKEIYNKEEYVQKKIKEEYIYNKEEYVQKKIKEGCI